MYKNVVVVLKQTVTYMNKRMKAWNECENKIYCVFAIQSFGYIDRKVSESE